MTSPSTLSRPVPGVLALLLALTACGPQEQGAPAPAESAAVPADTATGTPSEAAAPTPTTPPTASPGTSPGTSPGEPAPSSGPGTTAAPDDPGGGVAAGPSRWCTTDQLDLAAVPVGGAAGSVHVSLSATNTGGTPCTIGGYPGVSFVDASGAMIGAPAVRDTSAPGTGQVVAPGESVSAPLRVGQAGNYAACEAREAAGLLVYPPESTESVVIPFPAQACAGQQVQQLEIQGFGA